MSQERVTKAQIDDWVENPVTEALTELLQQELKDINNTPITTALVYGDPTKTHENLVELEAREMAWADLLRTLTGDWSYFAEEDEDDSKWKWLWSQSKG